MSKFKVGDIVTLDYCKFFEKNKAYTIQLAHGEVYLFKESDYAADETDIVGLAKYTQSPLWKKLEGLK